MSLLFPDEIKHNNDNYPVVDSNSIKGVGVFTSAIERDALPLNKRKLNYIASVSGKVYSYDGNDLTDINWVDSDNWKSYVDNPVVLSGNETPTGIVDGVNNVFETKQKYIEGTLRVFFDGLEQSGFVLEDGYNKTFIIDEPPVAGCSININYEVASDTYYSQPSSWSNITAPANTIYFDAKSWGKKIFRLACDYTQPSDYVFSNPRVESSNDCVTWESHGESFSSDSITVGFGKYAKLSVVNDGVIFCSFNNKLYKTSNGEFSEDSNLIHTFDSTIRAIHFISENIGFVGSGGKLYMTDDGCVTFAEIHDVSPNIIYSVHAISLKTITLLYSDIDNWIVQHPKVVNTVNGGGTWNTIVDEGLFGGSYLHGKNLNTCSSVYRTLYKSVDGGKNYTTVSIGTNSFTNVARNNNFYYAQWNALKSSTDGVTWGDVFDTDSNPVAATYPFISFAFNNDIAFIHNLEKTYIATK